MTEGLFSWWLIIVLFIDMRLSYMYELKLGIERLAWIREDYSRIKRSWRSSLLPRFIGFLLLGRSIEVQFTVVCSTWFYLVHVEDAIILFFRAHLPFAGILLVDHLSWSGPILIYVVWNIRLVIRFVEMLDRYLRRCWEFWPLIYLSFWIDLLSCLFLW